MTTGSPPPRFASVAVPLPIDHAFTYRVPQGSEEAARPGVRVVVPFGPRRVVGLIVGPAQDPASSGRAAREILSFLDAEPYIPASLLSFLLAGAKECLAPVGEMLRAALPRGLPRKEMPAAPRRETWYRAAEPLPASRLTPKQEAVLAAVRAAGLAPSSLLAEKVPGGAEAAHRMAARGLLLPEERDRARVPSTPHLPEAAVAVAPPVAQEEALAHLGVALASGAPRVFVLHGVTGSGKTEVYLRAVEQARLAGRPSILLVPEIALTPQLLGRVRARFGDGAAVLHSGLSAAERTAQWRKARAGEVFLCIGARSAVFAPFPSPGLIVVDEEHDGSYKQEDGVRYQARDLALLRGRMQGAVVLLGSATPSAESWEMARRGDAALLTLPERIGSAGTPEIRVVDLGARIGRRGADRYFSPELEDGVTEALAREEQAMLFLNRRGFAPVLACLDCSATVACRDCQVSMTFHRDLGKLLCHYCGRLQGVPEACPGCGGHRVAQLGIGTERLAAWAEKRWPQARVARLDSDVTRKRDAYADVLARMQRGDVDILVGTQMIAKGHDFPRVTFVGILMADLSLSFPDFRAAERTFQLLTQVSGRAGRGDAPGTVVVQTLSPDHDAIRKAVEHDLRGFLEAELSEREALGYPPFGRMLLFRLRGRHEEKAREASLAVADRLEKALEGKGIRILGPAPSPISRMKRMFRFQILLKMPPRFPVGDLFPPILADLREEARRHGVRIEADVDPYQMMV